MANERWGLLTLQEAMDILGVSRATIDRWRKDKQLPHIKVGKEIWVDPEKLEAWVYLHASRQSEAGKPKAAVREVTVGYQSGAALLWSTLVIKKLGLLEDELKRTSPSFSYKVNWVNAPNGMELVESLIGGKVHIASIGDYPMIASQQLSRMLPLFRPLFLAFDGKTAGGDGISLVVPKGSPVRSADDLSGRAIATVGHSSASYRLKQWIGANGLESVPVVRRTMGECLSGVLEGDVGASFMWEPYLSWAKSIGAGEPFPSEGIGGDYLTGLMADGNWANGNKDVVIAYLKAHLRAHAIMRGDPAKAAAIIAEASGYPVRVVAGVIAGIRWDASLYAKDVRTLDRLLGEQALAAPAAEPEGRAAAGFEAGQPYLLDAAESLKLPILSAAELAGEWSEEEHY
ncbi:helix-turn-helix domain-containing protein [Cohnella fermenti]|uniref:Helix-turn-helix domain-containing protein n=1 Tax=Cohnella fermenti TaxID=2565925 RepID=A0A4S4C2G2_9BACL|nr:helix-turn-helix domain-containing protein [Cohnella fermenti]THF81709.1 helix-turn-helix domain-containing protein [Cohnella fermenti]